MAAATNRATKLELVTRDIEERGAPQCRQQNFTEAMTTGGRSAAGFGRSAAGVRVRTRELHRSNIATDSQATESSQVNG